MKTLTVKHIKTDRGNCRKYFREITTQRLYCLIDGEDRLHICTNDGEPVANIKSDIKVSYLDAKK